METFLFWVHVYVAFRGLVAILGDFFQDATGASTEKTFGIRINMCSLKKLFTYVHRLRDYDLRHRQRFPDLPRMVVEGTYYPPVSRIKPYVKVHGETTDEDKVFLMQLLEKFPDFAGNAPGAHAKPWIRVLALKVHCAYYAFIGELHRLCRDKGVDFVVTVTNDPFVEPVVVAIGVHGPLAETFQDLLSKIPQLKLVFF